MSDLRELYQEIILDHNRSPRNFHEMPVPPARSIDGHNPLCGDHYTIYLLVEDGVVKDVSFTGSGCAISKASASVMTTLLKGRTRDEAEALFQRFHDLVTGGGEPDPDQIAALGKLAAFAGVREFPMRVKCASLAWHTMHTALASGDAEKVSTE